MPNIKQQKKRVGIAAGERLENLRYRSTVKTLTRRLASAVEEGDADRVRATHLELQRWIDRAASRGALHRNAAARKKSQAARLVSGSLGPVSAPDGAGSARSSCRRALASARARPRGGSPPLSAASSAASRTTAASSSSCE